MKYVRQLLLFILAILRALLYEWIVKLFELIGLLFAWIRRCCAKAMLPVRLKRSAKERCVKISDPAYKRPDPLIYDQYYLMGQGFAVTWDNPDIDLFHNGVFVPSHMLQPDTDYEVVARIWNNSTEAPVVGLPVNFGYLSFGMGVQSHFIGSTKVNLGVKGGPNHPAFAKVTWHTPAAPGHYCIQTSFFWSDDVNPNNNFGQENTDVGTAHSPVQFTFQLRNDTRKRQRYRFDTDGYAIPPRDPCDQRKPPLPPRSTPPREKPGTVAVVPPKHDRRNYPLPAGWTVTFLPAQPELDPNQEIQMTVTVTPPNGFKGRQPVNVHGFHADGLAGGVTLYVEGK